MISNFTFSRFSSPCGLLINILMTSVKAALFTCFDLLTGATTSTSDRWQEGSLYCRKRVNVNEAGILASLLILHASPNFNISRPMDYFEFFSAYLCL